jgi:long-chain-alcohol oxidase
VTGLTQRDLFAFTMVADTVLPAVAGDGPAWTTPGANLGLAANLPELFDRLPHDQHRRELGLFLGFLNSAPGGVALYGRPVAFTRLDQEGRADAYRRMLSHPNGKIRNGAASLKTLAVVLWITTEDPSRRLASWEAMGYPGPDGPPPRSPPVIDTVTIDSDTTMACDVVVVGSGAGGGVAAAVLASAGLDVVVLEAGGNHGPGEYTHLEADALKRMYLDGALNSTADGGMSMLAGATLGGGTVINYTTCFATPDWLRDQWDRQAGFDGVFTGDDFSASLGTVAGGFGVNTSNGAPARRDLILERGLKRLGWHVDEMPRNADGCTTEDCGYCTMGCRIGAKRSTLVTYLADATTHGARIVTGAHVDRVLTDRSRATGVIARVDGARELRVEARAVVLAAGALHTPAILLRSRLGGPAAGRYLRLHPVTAVWGRFEERVDPWTGIQQTRYSDEFADLDGEGYGFKFETAPIHPLFPAAFIGWDDGYSFKRDALGLGHFGVAGILLRDRDHGRVVIRRDGTPMWKYRISDYDQAHVRLAVRHGAELLVAAGATEAIASTVQPVRWAPSRGGTLAGFMTAVDAIGYGSNRTRYFSFHQMGSARMGRDPRSSVVDRANQTHDTHGLYVMDGSCFPSASGVNPMLTIAAIAHRGASLLAGRLA